MLGLIRLPPLFHHIHQDISGIRRITHFPHERDSSAAASSDFAPEAITGGGDPRSMVPVRLAGAEVTEGFCTKLAGLC